MASRAAGASVVHWLAEDIACDVVLPEVPDVGELTANLRAAVASEPVDVIVRESTAPPA